VPAPFPTTRSGRGQGGGLARSRAGRSRRAWGARAEPKARLKGAPDVSLARLHYDSIVHSPRALEFLIDSVGTDRVLLGSDYPFDMGNPDCVARVDAIAAPQDVRDRVVGLRAAELLRVGALHSPA